MNKNLDKIIKSLHDCNVDKIEIKQVSFSKDCPVDYPKDCFEIEIRIVKVEHEKLENHVIFHFSAIEEFFIKKTAVWEWLIFESNLVFKDGLYIFTIDDYIRIICSEIECITGESKNAFLQSIGKG